MSFFKELKERNVVKVAVIYAVTGWLLAQIADLALPAFGAPDWVLRVFLFFLLLGFPVALIMAWALELTPEGIRKAESSAGEKRMWSIAVILVVMVVAWFELGMQKESAPSAQVDSPVAVAAPAQGKAVEEQGVSIAVLPFIDLSSEQDQQFFALGMSEELLNVLAKIDRLEVASRTSAFAFQGSELGAQAIGRQLGVDHVLEGSIRKSGERLRITAQLIDVETDRHLWSDTYDRELADVFDIQDEITSAIVESLREPLGISPDAISVKADTDNFDAYRLFLEGRELFIKRDVRVSIERLERAVAIDPGFARGWEQLAAGYAVAPAWIGNDRPYDDLTVEAAERAIALDPGLSMAYAALSNAATSGDPDKVDWELGFRYIDQAIENDPNNATAHLWRGIGLARLGYYAEALEASQRCVDIDPGYSNCFRHLSWGNAALGNFDKAMEYAVEAMERDFFGEDEMATTVIYLRAGNRPAALLFASMVNDYFELDFPDWLLVVENPAAYPDRKRQLLERVRQLLAEDGKQFHLSLNFLLIMLGHADEVRVSGNESVFLDARLAGGDHIGSEAFMDHVRQLKLDGYWDKHGPPPQCRKLGSNYECQLP